MTDYYNADLAFIHDAGYGDFARETAPGLLDILDRSGITEGLVVDLGCGSGLWAEQLATRGYNVIGIDISNAMIRLARRRVPKAVFRVASLFDAEIPPCDAVTSLGECISYLFDPNAAGRRSDPIFNLFCRVYAALAPGGVFIFDIMEPGEMGRETSTRSFSEGKDWLVTIEKSEDRKRGILTRRITTFRRVGRCYRRTDESHEVGLHTAKEVAEMLRKAGFTARIVRSYGNYPLRKARAGFIARKPR
jgi:SAM-dependent methyltransferase